MDKENNNLQEENLHKQSRKLEYLILLMVLLLPIIYFADSIFITIPAGHKGVLYKRFAGGTVTDKVYNEGFHVIFPWDIIEPYNVRIQEQKDTVDALTEDGLEVQVEISYRYHPEEDKLGVLHKRLGPHYAHTIIIPNITAITRDEISRRRVDKLYSTSREEIQEEMTRLVKAQIADKYPLEVIDVVIKSVILHDLVSDAIAKKLVEEQKMLEYEFIIGRETKEAERKLVEAKGIEAARMVEAEGIQKFRRISRTDILQWEGINATKDLAKSPNSKVIIIGTDEGDLPVILNGGG